MKKFKTLQELFKQDGVWTQKTMYRYYDDTPCPSSDAQSATSCCLVGGLRFIYGNSPRYQSLLNRLFKHIKDKSLSAWNDRKSRTIKDIRALVKKANV